MHAVALRYLDQVARSGSMRRAAELLRVSSSAINRQILKLEEEMGVSLFERRGNGVHLTPAGERIVRHARETLADWQRTQAEIGTLAGDIHGEAKMLSIRSLLIDVVPRAVMAVSRRHPHMSFRITHAEPAHSAEELRASDPDLALLFIDRRYRQYDIVARINAPLGAVMHPDHPLAKSKQVTLTDCARYPVILLRNPWILSATSETEFVRSGAQFRARVITNSLSVAKEVMKDGGGLGFFTVTGFIEEIQRGELVHVPLAVPRLAQMEIGLYLHRARGTSDHIRVLSEALQDQLRQLNDVLRDLPNRTATRPSSRRATQRGENSARTASVSAPRAGGGRRIATGAPDMRSGEPTRRRRPPFPSGPSSTS